MTVKWSGRSFGHISRYSAATPIAALSLNFLTTTSLDSRITFTRSSTATFVGSNGLIQTAAANTPRLDYDPVTLAPRGLLIEEQRTNLFAYSEQFDNAAWGKTELTVSTNTSTAPDGTATADAVILTTNTAAHFVTLGVSMTAGVTYALSIYAKASGYRWLRLSFAAAAFPANNRAASFDLQTGAVGQVQSGVTATISDAGNGWYRCTIVATATTTAVAANGYTVNDADNANATSFAGNGTSGILLWGAQLEAGAFATSYIPTVASQVTRTADVATMTGTNFSNWYNQSEGTFAVEASVLLNTGNRVWMDVGPAGAFGTTAYVVQTSSSVALSPATAPVNMLSQVNTTSLLNKAAIGIANNNSVAAVNGTLGAVDTSCTMPASATQLTIGGAVWGPGGLLNGHIRSLVYYSVRLTNAQLQALTA